jgi:hypothetical protein
MAIQIIDGFQVNTASPIDNRIVASGSAARNAIPYKYEGLRIFDISDNIPYVYLNGNWVSENASGVVGSSTTANYIPKFNGTNIVGNSIIYATGSSIGVNTTSPTAIVGETTVFHVNGGIRANRFVGDGANIGSMSAANITTGNLSLSRFTNGSTNWVLTGAVGSPTYSNPAQMTVGTASVAVNALSALSASASSQVSITGTDTSATERYLTFIDTINLSPINNTVKANTNLRFKPSTGQLLINSGSSSAPGIGIVGTTNTGIYKYSTSGLGITIGSTASATFNTDGIRHVNTTFSGGGSFVVGTGTLTSTTQITISSATYDRIVYMFSSSNNNWYYRSAGWFQIEVYIAAQQIYSNFSGENNIRPSFGYSYILPAGLASTIKLERNSLTWSSGSGPTIYATTLKFGL